MLRKQLKSLSNDLEIKEYTLSGMNRISSMNPPSAWDDLRIAASFEYNYRNKI